MPRRARVDQRFVLSPDAVIEPQPVASDVVSVASFNMLADSLHMHGERRTPADTWANRWPVLRAQLEPLEVDVVCLQEVDEASVVSRMPACALVNAVGVRAYVRTCSACVSFVLRGFFVGLTSVRRPPLASAGWSIRCLPESSEACAPTQGAPTTGANLHFTSQALPRVLLPTAPPDYFPRPAPCVLFRPRLRWRVPREREAQVRQCHVLGASCVRVLKDRCPHGELPTGSTESERAQCWRDRAQPTRSPIRRCSRTQQHEDLQHQQ
jgi:hypothetical protein